MSKRRYTSLKIQKPLNALLESRVISDGYGMKGKSKWIAEAIEKFLCFHDYPDLIDIANMANNFDHNISIILSEEIYHKIEDAIVIVRRKFPTIEPVQSLVIRASIMQRLIRNSIEWS